MIVPPPPIDAVTANAKSTTGSIRFFFARQRKVFILTSTRYVRHQCSCNNLEHPAPALSSGNQPDYCQDRRLAILNWLIKYGQDGLTSPSALGLDFATDAFRTKYFAKRGKFCAWCEQPAARGKLQVCSHCKAVYYWSCGVCRGRPRHPSCGLARSHGPQHQRHLVSYLCNVK